MSIEIHLQEKRSVICTQNQSRWKEGAHCKTPITHPAGVLKEVVKMILFRFKFSYFYHLGAIAILTANIFHFSLEIYELELEKTKISCIHQQKTNILPDIHMNGQEECAILTRSDVLCSSKFYYTSPSGPYPAKCACVLRSEDCKRSLTIADSKQYRLLKGNEYIHVTFDSSMIC